ncbi:MAG: FtsQ-type POTRA domain-containing protein [Candidatus Omnitrophica bacterium]|nr:FtsQ-type POTRA domain-containing protein [Candidatus Omnitrophota bacterium]
MKTLQFLWASGIFEIKEIKIYPENMSYIREMLELEKDKNLLFLDIENLMEKINFISEVEGCKITKKFPSTIEINLILRKPWAILKYNEKEFLIDKNGVILNNERENLTGLLYIYGIKVNEKENKVEENEKVNVLVEFEKWYNYFNIGNFFKLKKVDISDLNKIEISDGEKSIFFSKENIKIKLEKLVIVLKNLNNNFEYIDTRFKNFYIKY